MRSISRAALIAVVLILVPAGAAEADTFRVNKFGDSAPGACTPSHCTLREAVLAANNDSPGSDTVVLPNRKKAYKLTIPNALPGGEDGGTEGDLDVTNDPLTLLHKGKGRATIDQRTADRVIQSFTGLTLKRIAITGGDAVNLGGDGGGILTMARLVLSRSAVSGNAADDGGGIDLTGPASLKMSRSSVSRNSSADDGGGVRLSNSPAQSNSIVRSQLIGNQGDGESTAEGGAIYMSTTGTELRIRSTTMAGNDGVGRGGAISSDSSNDEIRIANSTFAGNQADAIGGGALFIDSSSARIVNSTFSGNRTREFGGGVFVSGAGDLSLNAVTIVRNHGATDDEGALAPGGGIFRNTSGTVSVRNSIIALNRIGADPVADDCAGEVGQPFDSFGGNLLSKSSSICVGFDEPGDRFRARPKLGNLRRNGGPTKTVALKEGSPAIGNARKQSAPNRDQRGRKRDDDPDSGAFERGA